MQKKTLLSLVVLTFSLSSYADYSRVSVHDPSVVWDPGTERYYIFGSHRASAWSSDMMNWTDFVANWQTYNNDNAANSAAFTTPAVTKVKKRGSMVDLPNFNAIAWASHGSFYYNVDGNMWAPDVIWNPFMNKWCMYLSVNGDNWYSSIILLTADQITGPYRYQAPVVVSGFKRGTEYKETDLELVLGTQNSLPARYAMGSTGSGNWGERWPNNIDPCVFFDEEGRLWMSYGSWSGGIWMLELDEYTGLRDYDVEYPLTGSGNDIIVDPYFGKKIAGGYYVSGEASYIEYIGGYYFLFMSYGGLAAGGDPNDYNNGGYQIRLFRSEHPDGPYVDTQNESAIYNRYLLNFGAKANTNRGMNIFGAYTDWGKQTVGNLGERSQGHNSVIAAEDGRTYLVYHTRFQNWGETHQVRVHQLFQNEDGWLVAAPFEYSGEELKSEEIATTQQVATQQISGYYKLLIHRYKLNHTSKETIVPVEIELMSDGRVSGEYTGQWTIQEGTSYLTITLNGKSYKGVAIEQTMEPSNEQTVAFSAVADDGVSVWGYKYAESTSLNLSKADDERVGAVYDLQGRRLSQPEKGIYIQGGKSYMKLDTSVEQ